MKGDGTLYGFQISRRLGRGSEGEVFTALKNGRQYILKVFHSPVHNPVTERSLEAYHDRVNTKEAGFYPIELVRKEGNIVGLYYDYEPLCGIPVHWRGRSDRLGQVVLSQYCSSQAYLIGRHSMAMQDGAQFLLGKDGHLHYVDYGSTIARTDEEWCRTRGYIVFSFLEVLFEPCGIAPDARTRRQGFDYGQPCTMVSVAQQDALCRRSPWTRPIVERIRRENAAVFLDPSFYRWIADMYEPVVSHPSWLFGLSRLYRARVALRGQLRRVVNPG